MRSLHTHYGGTCTWRIFVYVCIILPCILVAPLGWFFFIVIFLILFNFQVASGNKTVENWATKRLRAHYYIFSYPSLLKLHGEQALLRNLDSLLGNEALLQLELKTLSPAFKDVKKQKWFEEVIDNYLKLWESNM